MGSKFVPTFGCLKQREVALDANLKQKVVHVEGWVKGQLRLVSVLYSGDLERAGWLP